MGDIQIMIFPPPGISSAWPRSRHGAMRLGIRKSGRGDERQADHPRSAINNLRRCLQVVFSITSSDESTLPTGSSQLASSSSSLLNRQSSSTLNQSTLESSHISSRLSTALQSPSSSRADELSRQTLPALRALCKSYGVRVTGRKQELVDRLLAVENAFKQGVTAARNAPRTIPSSLLPPSPRPSPPACDLLHLRRGESAAPAAPRGV